jgi:hypothetical protein
MKDQAGSMDKRSVYFVGYARLPESTPVKKQLDRVAVGIEVDMETGIVLDASVTIPTELGQKVIRSCIVGYNIRWDFEFVAKNIERRFQGEAQKAIIMALKNAVDKFRSYAFEK